MGGILPYKWEVHCNAKFLWEVYCWASLSSRLRSQEGTAIQMGGVLPHKLEVYCSTFSETSRGWGLSNSSEVAPCFSSAVRNLWLRGGAFPRTCPLWTGDSGWLSLLLQQRQLVQLEPTTLARLDKHVSLRQQQKGERGIM